MVIHFDRYLNRRLQKEQYRKELIDRILAHHQHKADGDSEESLYLEHVKSGFPIEILENIVEKIEQQRTGSQ